MAILLSQNGNGFTYGLGFSGLIGEDSKTMKLELAERR